MSIHLGPLYQVGNQEMIRVASISKIAPDGEGILQTLPCAPLGARKDSPAPPP